MIRSEIKVFEQFGQITERVEQAAIEGLNAAAREAAVVAQAKASIDLKIEVIPAHGDVDGYAAGIRSRKESSAPGATTPIAGFFDKGTLGKRRRPTKRPRKSSWQVNRGDSSYSAHRHDLDDSKGIAPQGFFGKARAAGRRKLLDRIARLHQL